MPAGTWILTGNMNVPGSGNLYTNLSISTTSITHDTSSGTGVYINTSMAPCLQCIKIVQISSSTTYYLVASCDTAGSTINNVRFYALRIA